MVPVRRPSRYIYIYIYLGAIVDREGGGSKYMKNTLQKTRVHYRDCRRCGQPEVSFIGG